MQALSNAKEVKGEITQFKGIQTPQDRIRSNADLIKVLGPAIMSNYVVNISSKSYVMVAGLQSIGSALGYSVRVVSCVHKPASEGLAGHWEANAIVVDTNTGLEIAQGLGHVFDDESPWGKRPRFAQAAMCQTRATGRALKGAVGFLLALIGAETSFAEEMPQQDYSEAPPKQLPQAPANTTPLKKYDDLADKGTSQFNLTSVEVVKTGTSKFGEWTLTKFVTAQGPSFSSINKGITQDATDHYNANNPVEITWERTPKGGLNIVSITEFCPQ
jgi:hypothetical protein